MKGPAVKDKLKTFYQDHKNDIDPNHVIVAGCMGAMFLLGRQSVGASAIHILDDGKTAAAFVELTNGRVLRPTINMLRLNNM